MKSSSKSDKIELSLEVQHENINDQFALCRTCCAYNWASRAVDPKRLSGDISDGRRLEG